MTPAQISMLAARLHEAEHARRQIRAFSLQHPEMSIDDAYAVQRALIELKLAEGRRIRGLKIGLTSRAMQQAVGIDEPDFGVLLDDMFHSSGARITTARFIEPRVEMELAFILNRPLHGPDCQPVDVWRATEFVVPALEILDSRMHRIDPETKAMRKVTDTISDNAANAALVLSDNVFEPRGLDLRWVSAILTRNSVVEETGVAAGVLGNPINGIAWLANRLHPHGVHLEPGQVILSGSFTRPVDARAGDQFHADYGPLGTIACQFC